MRMGATFGPLTKMMDILSKCDGVQYGGGEKIGCKDVVPTSCQKDFKTLPPLYLRSRTRFREHL